MSKLAIKTTVAPVSTKVRYINTEWKDRGDSSRIGSREGRRTATSFKVVRIYDARHRLKAGNLTLDKNGFT